VWEGVEILGLLLGSVIFGGIHLAAWNFDFPTGIEQLLWRVASLWCTCFFIIVPFILFPIMVVSDALHLPKIDTTRPAQLFLILYVVARLYLLVEIFRTLFFLLPSAYVSTWATNVPHVA
jgi:hypothetical protein